jgi:predicted ATPase/DNA-binding SARP family transcriptional activator
MPPTVSETDSTPLSLSLFGPMWARVRGQDIPRVRSRKSLWLLALLVLRGGRQVEREWLAETLWPDVDQDVAFANLRPALSDLRRALGGEAERLRSPSRHTLSLNLQGAAVDVLAFDAAVAGKTLPELERAVALYRGPLLEGCVEEWASQERSAREQDCLRALATLAEAALTAGDNDAATDYFRRALGVAPGWEAARRGLMEALARGGDSNGAMHVYREFVALLRGDPKAVPDTQTSALYTRLRAEARQRVTHGAAGETAAVTPARTVDGYIPYPLTDLVGREDERAEVAFRLRRSRLVTLTGPGGIGKTRLALAVAAEVVPDYADGVWFVSLDSLLVPSLYARQIANVLNLKEEPNRPCLGVVTDHLRAKRLLLVLDNCEHLLEASVQAARHLLRECAGVRILATSREALGVTGETTWALPVLAVPVPEHLPPGQATQLRVLMGYDGVQLFVERAQAVQKTFVLTGGNALAIAQVCARLEGLPLAIELAAARIKAMTVEQIAERLDDYLGLLTGGSRTAQPRQQTMRATLDWSYDLLTEAERLLLARLSVFAGGWDLRGAEAICPGDGLHAGKILDLLGSLIDKSLVVFEEKELGGRYRLLETVRQYAAEKLAGGGDERKVQARHRDHFLVLAEEAEPHLTGAAQVEWLARLEAEHANLRVALDWCSTEESGAEAGLRLSGALGRFWEIRGHYGEGRACLTLALLRRETGGRGRARAKALNVAGVLAYYQGEYATAEAAHQESLALFREHEDSSGVAWVLNDLGDVAGARGDDESAQALFTESLALFRRLENKQGIAKLLHHLGRLVRDQGDLAGAEALYAESLTLVRELNDRQGTAWALHHMGHLTGRQGNFVLAQSQQEEGLVIFRDLGNRQGAAWALQELGRLAVLQSDYVSAQRLYEESLEAFRDLGNKQGIATTLEHLGTVAAAQNAQAAAHEARAEALTIYRELGNEQGADRLFPLLAEIIL